MDLKEFRSSYQQFLSRASSEDDIVTWLNIYWRRLPPFPEGQLVEEDYIEKRYFYKDLTFSTASHFYKEAYTTDVAVSKCIGNTWLFCNDHSTGRPLPEKLASCLYHPPNTAPPLFAEKMGDYYFCGDGNHRIYAAYLLGRPVELTVDSYHELIE